jgi:hypothetical protein
MSLANTQFSTSAISWWHVRSACRPWLLALLLTLPAPAHAQFTCTTNSGTITITGYMGPGGAVVIPSTTNGLPVTSIGDYAFNLLASLTSITIPSSVTNVGDGAFAYCSNLTSIAIPSSVAAIGNFEFQGCTSLASIAIPGSVSGIGEFAFQDCTGLASITIPNSVTNIGAAAFWTCTGLTNVTMGRNVANIEQTAFDDCYHLKGVYFTGNAPITAESYSTFSRDPAIAYYLPGTTGWGPTLGGELPSGGLQTMLWNPLMQTSGAGFGMGTNGFGFDITGSNNLVVVVEATTNLANPVWTAVATNTLTGGTAYFSDPYWTNYPARFYGLIMP